MLAQLVVLLSIVAMVMADSAPVNVMYNKKGAVLFGIVGACLIVAYIIISIVQRHYNDIDALKAAEEKKRKVAQLNEKAASSNPIRGTSLSVTK
jgi:hypothetical protein